MTFLCILIVPFVLSGVVGSLFYWYEALNDPCPEIPPPPFTVRTCLVFFVGAAVGHLAAVVLRLVGLAIARTRMFTPHRESCFPPVLLIHGVYHNDGAWLYLGNKLKNAGYPVLSYSYGSFFTSFEEVMAGLDECIRGLEDAFPQKKPIVVAHSLGGVLIRHWLQESENSQRLTGVITLGTPHRGSRMATLALGRIVKEIAPHCPRLIRLNAEAYASSDEELGLQKGSPEKVSLINSAQDKPWQPLPCTALCSPTDEAVVPACLLVPPTGWKLCVTAPVSHFSLLVSPQIAKAVLQEMRTLH